jgi:hypothetical protein
VQKYLQSSDAVIDRAPPLEDQQDKERRKRKRKKKRVGEEKRGVE